jgi:outer membrane protein OmpA-like peptidoglycan-associated protein
MRHTAAFAALMILAVGGTHAQSRLQLQPLQAGGGATAAEPVTRLSPPMAPARSRVKMTALARSEVTIAALTASRVLIEPLDATATVAAAALKSELGARETERGTLISLPGDVLFDFDKYAIRRDARPTLARLAELIRQMPEGRVLIEGHTDAKGSEAYNLKLSERRAEAVAEWLGVQEGIDTTRLDRRGLGEARPAAPNTRADGRDDPEGRQRNRRVEVILTR